MEKSKCRVQTMQVSLAHGDWRNEIRLSSQNSQAVCEVMGVGESPGALW